MAKTSYATTASDYLTRAKEQLELGRENPANLFYVALELRFGIESRYREYLEMQEHVNQKKKMGWKLALLDRTIEDAFSGCVQEVQIKIACGGYPVAFFKYTPVTAQLKEVGEKLGNYLHAPKKDDLDSADKWGEFGALLERGVSLLEYACSGNLLGVPLRNPSTNLFSLNAIASEDQISVFDAIGQGKHDLEFTVSYHHPYSG